MILATNRVLNWSLPINVTRVSEDPNNNQVSLLLPHRAPAPRVCARAVGVGVCVVCVCVCGFVFVCVVCGLRCVCVCVCVAVWLCGVCLERSLSVCSAQQFVCLVFANFRPCFAPWFPQSGPRPRETPSF